MSKILHESENWMHFIMRPRHLRNCKVLECFSLKIRIGKLWFNCNSVDPIFLMQTVLLIANEKQPRGRFVRWLQTRRIVVATPTHPVIYNPITTTPNGPVTTGATSTTPTTVSTSPDGPTLSSPIGGTPAVGGTPGATSSGGPSAPAAAGGPSGPGGAAGLGGASGSGGAGGGSGGAASPAASGPERFEVERQVVHLGERPVVLLAELPVVELLVLPEVDLRVEVDHPVEVKAVDFSRSRTISRFIQNSIYRTGLT